MKKERGFIYFLAKGTDCVKIGYTKARKGKTKEECVQIRMKNLQTACEKPLKILYILEGTMDTERYYLHKFFETCKINGEWFSYKDITRWIVHDKLEKQIQKELGLIK